jgi:hypothetical protein
VTNWGKNVGGLKQLRGKGEGLVRDVTATGEGV